MSALFTDRLPSVVSIFNAVVIGIVLIPQVVVTGVGDDPKAAGQMGADGGLVLLVHAVAEPEGAFGFQMRDDFPEQPGGAALSPTVGAGLQSFQIVESRLHLVQAESRDPLPASSST